MCRCAVGVQLLEACESEMTCRYLNWLFATLKNSQICTSAHCTLVRCHQHRWRARGRTRKIEIFFFWKSATPIRFAFLLLWKCRYKIWRGKTFRSLATMRMRSVIRHRKIQCVDMSRQCGITFMTQSFIIINLDDYISPSIIRIHCPF